MAGRPIKKGLDYFPFPTDFFEDTRIKFINSRFGIKGLSIITQLLCQIYKNSYYLEFNDDYVLLFSNSIGSGNLTALVKDVVYEAIKRDFFDKEIFNNFKILTSKEIQINFLRVATERSLIQIVRQYWLVEIPKSSELRKVNVIEIRTNQPENIINRSDNSINRSINAQRKEKESKEKNLIVATKVATKKKQGKIFELDSIEYKSAKYLADEILKRNPNAKVPKTDTEISKWCIHIDYLLRLDKKPIDELRRVLVFAVKDPFWSSVILSTSSLRKNYDRLFVQMCNKGVKNIGANKSNFEQQVNEPERTIEDECFELTI